MPLITKQIHAPLGLIG